MKNKIVWSEQSKRDLLAIASFFDNRNKSTVYSKKLLRTFKAAVELIAKFPLLSIGTNKDNIRAYIVKSYIIYFEIKFESIYVLTVWDSRRDPSQFDKLIEQ